MSQSQSLYVPSYQSLYKGMGSQDIPIPATKDKEGNLLDVVKEAFPGTKEGRQAYLNYDAACAAFKAKAWERQGDPAFQLEQKLNKERQKLVEMEKLLADAKAGKVKLEKKTFPAKKKAAK